MCTLTKTYKPTQFWVVALLCCQHAKRHQNSGTEHGEAHDHSSPEQKYTVDVVPPWPWYPLSRRYGSANRFWMSWTPASSLQVLLDGLFRWQTYTVWPDSVVSICPSKFTHLMLVSWNLLSLWTEICAWSLPLILGIDCKTCGWLLTLNFY